MKRRSILVFALILLALAVAACGGRATESIAEESFAGSAAPEMPAAEPAADAAIFESAVSTEFDTATANQPPAGQERLIIRTADMAIVATDTEEALSRIAEMADSSGGWVVSSNVFQSSDTSKTGYIQIRVPSEGFQSVLDAIAGLSVEVTNLSTSGQDVTEEFVDLDARLGNLEATAARLRTFLDEARNVEEALAVNVELSRVEGEIESIKGRMQYLEQSSAFSSITVNVTPDELAQPIEVAGWQPQGVAKQAVEALISALQVVANAVIWFVIFALPILLVIAIPIALVIWVIRRLRRRELVVATTRVETPAGED
jgi:hypothetical protein